MPCKSAAREQVQDGTLQFCRIQRAAAFLCPRARPARMAGIITTAWENVLPVMVSWISRRSAAARFTPRSIGSADLVSLELSCGSRRPMPSTARASDRRGGDRTRGRPRSARLLGSSGTRWPLGHPAGHVRLAAHRCGKCTPGPLVRWSCVLPCAEVVRILTEVGRGMPLRSSMCRMSALMSSNLPSSVG